MIKQMTSEELKNLILHGNKEIIKEVLENRHMTQKELASRMDMSEKHISKLINGEVPLTQDVALRLERVFGVDANLRTFTK